MKDNEPQNLLKNGLSLNLILPTKNIYRLEEEVKVVKENITNEKPKVKNIKGYAKQKNIKEHTNLKNIVNKILYMANIYE